MNLSKIIAAMMVEKVEVRKCIDLIALGKAWAGEAIESFKKEHEKHTDLRTELLLECGMDFDVVADDVKLRVNISFTHEEQDDEFMIGGLFTWFNFYDGPIRVIAGTYELRGSPARFSDPDGFGAGLYLNETNASGKYNRQQLYRFLVAFCDALRIREIIDNSMPCVRGMAEDLAALLEDNPDAASLAGFLGAENFDIAAPHRKALESANMGMIKAVMANFDSVAVQKHICEHHEQCPHGDYEPDNTATILPQRVCNMAESHAMTVPNNSPVLRLLTLGIESRRFDVVENYWEFFKLFLMQSHKDITSDDLAKMNPVRAGIHVCGVLHHLYYMMYRNNREYLYPAFLTMPQYLRWESPDATAPIAAE